MAVHTKEIEQALVLRSPCLLIDCSYQLQAM